MQTLVEGSLEGIWLGTFHSQCAKSRKSVTYFVTNILIFSPRL